MQAGVVRGQAHRGGALASAVEPVALDADRELLLAEELGLLVHRAGDVPWLGSAFGTCLVGALLADLVISERLVVEDGTEGASIGRVLDATPTGDDLLDAALRALAAGVPPSPLAPWRLLGAVDRRRIRRRGTVEPSDLFSWWNGYWSTSDVPHATPTLLRQVLTVHECLNTVMERVNERLRNRGLLVLDPRVRRSAQRGDRWRSGVVDERACDAVAERWRELRAGYLYALPVAELRALTSEAAARQVSISASHGDLAAVVGEIVSQWKAWSEAPG